MVAKKEDETTEPQGYAVKGNDLSNYIGVAPEYQTYANSVDKPLAGGSKMEKIVEKRAHEHVDRVVVEINDAGIQVAPEDSKKE